MSGLIYLLLEGVHDVAFVRKILSVCFGATRVKTLEDLDEATQRWMASFKWPFSQSGKTSIARLSVPAPEFLRLPTGEMVGLRNANGITELGRTLSVDLESFARKTIAIDAVGIVLDSDDQPPAARYEEMKLHLAAQQLPVPGALAQVSVSTPRVGVFALPDSNNTGTLEDILLALGGVAYSDLTAAAQVYARAWHAKVAGDASKEWREIKKPAGIKKATIGAMTAVLKPGRATAATIEDHCWVSDATKADACLAPCLAFLQALIAKGAPPEPPQPPIPAAASGAGP
jgi:hypothetical protein